jgi:hypothetical protein
MTISFSFWGISVVGIVFIVRTVQMKLALGLRKFLASKIKTTPCIKGRK